MRDYFLWEKGQKKYFQLPQSWQVLNNVAAEPEKVKKTIQEMVDESLANPVGTFPLKNIIKPTDKVLIIADDAARPTPKKEILTRLIDYLKKCGVAYEQIEILFGGGTHRALTETEVERALGKELMGKIRYSNHDARSEALVPIGRLKTGGEIRVNPLLIKADFRIGVGSILPHPWNGFGGGGKIILPGVSSYETIREHHSSYRLAKGAFIGNNKDNPFYEEICEAARLARLDYVVNTLYNANGEVKGIVTGHFRAAYEWGAKQSLEEFAVTIDQEADVGILSTFPLDEGPQAMKPLLAAALITKRGGTAILAAKLQGEMPEGLLVAFETAYRLAKGDPRKLVLDHIEKRRLIIENAPLDFNSALNLTLLNLSRVNPIIVSEEVSTNQATRLGFRHASSLDEAISMVYKTTPEATVNILAAGGLTIPIVGKVLGFGEMYA